jgi:SAM-dependent methyltransferase
MHQQAREWVARYATNEPVHVLEIGGRNINGTIRDLFPAADYLTLDVMPGEGVDVVADAATWETDDRFDVVVCCEVFEHTAVWHSICHTAYAVLKPGGLFIATMAGPGRAAHSAFDGAALKSGEHYANIDPLDLHTVLKTAGFVDITIDQQDRPADVRATAVHGDEREE